MRVICHLGRLRVAAGLNFNQAAAAAGLRPGALDALERGRAVPDDDQVAALIRVYGPPSGWYPPELAALLVPDVRWCEGCGDELGSSAAAGALYHDAACQDAHRERLHSSGPGVSVEGLENAGGASPTPPANTPMTTGGQDGR